MRTGISNLVVLGAAAVVALALFAFGMGYPLPLRVRGDAYVYLVIADNFDSLRTALAFLGDRTAGMPLFDFAIRRVLGLFVATEQPQPWVDVICAALLAIHFASCWFFAGWVKRAGFIRSDAAARLLFFFLATFPALVGHTTTPLTDTLAIDLILCGGVLMARALDAQGLARALFIALAAGLLLGFSILVRSGSLPGVAAGFLVAATILLPNGRRAQAALGATVLGCLVMLAPYYANCASAHASLCLQYPAFDPVVSAQAGLRGARTLWSRPVTTKDEIPTLPDRLMMDNYGERCQLTSMIGVRSSSLTGCLLSRPLTLPVLLVKKWIGLFDHFRFTPYLEFTTPDWLRWLSRGYDCLAWAGFALAFATAGRASMRRNHAAVKGLAARNPAAVFLVVYSAVMLAVHTVQHVEDRYGFPVLPLCAVVLVACCEKGIAAYRVGGRRAVAAPLALCAAAIVLFLVQIVAWDLSAL